MDMFLANKGAYAVMAFAAISVPSAAVGIAYFWHRVRQAEVNAALKKDMLDRGMSANEIRIIIEAGAEPMPNGSQL